MWIALALLAAVASAGTSLLLKRAVGLAGAVVSTVAFRTFGGVLLAIASFGGGGWPALTPTFWAALGIVIPNEIGGMLFLSLALRRGDVSAVQPIMGLIPLLAMAGGALFLHEVPSALAVVGILLVVAGLYLVGLRRGRLARWSPSAPSPARARAGTPCSRRCSGPSRRSSTRSASRRSVRSPGRRRSPWARRSRSRSRFRSSRWRTGSIGLPHARRAMGAARRDRRLMLRRPADGLHNAMRLSQAGYVLAVVSMSILIATAVGVLVLREEGGGHRISGALLVSSGVGLIALFG